MNKKGLVTSMVAIAIFGLAACEKSEIPIGESLEGTYVGTIINQD